MFRLSPMILPLWLGLCVLGASCAPRAEPTQRDVERGLAASDRYVSAQTPRQAAGDGAAAGADRTPIALLNGEPISQSELARPLNEIAGGLILEETLLDRLLDRELERLGIEIGPEQAIGEERLLLRTLTDNQLARADAEAQLILDQLRRQRGLGVVRYRALLHRNAALRALVQTEVTISPADLQQAYQLRYGPRHIVRLITVGSASEASNVMRQLREGAPFAELASQVSTDPSRERGGLLPPIRMADTSFPSTLLAALRDLDVGERSSILALDASYAIITLESIVPAPADAPAGVDDVRDQLEQDARLYQERVLMDDLARRLLDSASITVLEPSLDRAWRLRTNRE